MDKQDKPRLAEVLGVEVGEKFIIRTIGKDVKCVITAGGVPGCEYAFVIYAINHPESIIRFPRLTEPEIAIMRDVRARWVSWNPGDDYVDLWTVEPVRALDGHCSAFCRAAARVLCSRFPSVKPGECIDLEESGDGQ